MTADQVPICKGCDLPMPSDWCWQNRMFDCWSSLPPRHIDTVALWRELKDVRSRLEMLEEPPT